MKGDWYNKGPDNWTQIRLGDSITLLNGYPFSSEFFHPSKGVPLIRIRDIYSKDTEVKYCGEVIPEAIINTGEILIGMDGDFNVSRWKGDKALLNQRVCCIRPLSNLNPTYLYYILRFPLKEINATKYSTTVKYLSNQDINKIRLSLPSFSIQKRIGLYLDEKIGEIDTLIQAKKKLLDLLIIKRESLISQTVRKGTNQKVPLKKSTYDWIGEIPKHWQIERSKWLFPPRDERSIHGEEELLTVSHLTGVTPRSEKSVNMFEAESKEGYKVCYKGDLVINTLWAWMGAMGIAPMKGIVSPAYHVYRINTDRILPEYIDALVRLPVFVTEVTRYSKGVWSSRLRLYPEGLYEVYLPVPPLEEQKEIVAHIKQSTEKIDNLKIAAKKSIHLLKERRTALIAAAVTGQLDIKEEP